MSSEVGRVARETAVNRPGFGHVAFAVEDVPAAVEVVSLEAPGAGTVTFACLTDPEGNVVEVQRWSAVTEEISMNVSSRLKG